MDVRSIGTKIEFFSGCRVFTKAVALPQDCGNGQHFFEGPLFFLPGRPRCARFAKRPAVWHQQPREKLKDSRK